MYLSHNKASLYGWELLAPRPTLKLEDHQLSAVCYCLFNIFAPTLHIGGCSSVCNSSTHHAAVTGPTYHGSLCDKWQLNPIMFIIMQPSWQQ